MYNNGMNPMGYPADAFFNQEASHDYYSMPPENYYPYPMPPENHHPYPPPCPDFPPMPPMPPPMPPIPPVDPWSGLKVQCFMHMKQLLEKMKDKKVALIIEGAKGNFECTKITKVDDCTVIVETRNGVCVIPLEEITAVCMTKEVADEIFKNKKPRAD